MSRLHFGRRNFLQSVSTGTVAFFAGCSSLNRTETTETEDLPSLQRVTVKNHDATRRTVDIIIERDDEIVYWNDFEIQASNQSKNITYGPEIAPPTFESISAKWVVSSRLSNKTTGETFDLTEIGSSGCYDVMVQIKEDTIEFLHDTPECGVVSEVKSPQPAMSGEKSPG